MAVYVLHLILGVIMALADVNGYKALWHPYDGYNLPYRLLYPYNYEPAQSYPLMVFTHGSGETGTDNLQVNSFSIASAFNNTTAAYQDWPCFVICPQVPAINPGYYGNLDAYSFENEYHSTYPKVSSQSWYVAAVLDLINKIQESGFIFYNESDLSGEAVLDNCNINSNKIYCLGASLGGKACWSFAKQGRNVFAGIINTLTWNCKQPYTDYYRVSSDDYDSNVLLRHKREFERLYHIPMMLMDGQSDTMYPTMQGLHEASISAINNYGLDNNLYYISISGQGHSINVINSIFNSANLFDTSNHSEQQYSTGTNPMDWLFSLSKPETPTDPYPDEEETYFLNERSYAVIANTTQTLAKQDSGLERLYNVDLTKDVYCRIAGWDIAMSDFTITNRQSVMDCFDLWYRGLENSLDKLPQRQYLII